MPHDGYLPSASTAAGSPAEAAARAGDAAQAGFLSSAVQQLALFWSESWQSYSDFLQHSQLTLDAMPPNLMPIN